MNKKKALIVVDMQTDFIEGSLGSEEARKIVPNVVKYIEDFDGLVFVTMDTHGEDYMKTVEGKHLPVPHCMLGSNGWIIDRNVNQALKKKQVLHIYNKDTFGCIKLFEEIPNEVEEIYIIGLCTDICVVSQALLAKAFFKDAEVYVVKDCCAGVTPETHEAALTTMKMCHVNVI